METEIFARLLRHGMTADHGFRHRRVVRQTRGQGVALFPAQGLDPGRMPGVQVVTPATHGHVTEICLRMLGVSKS